MCTSDNLALSARAYQNGDQNNDRCHVDRALHGLQSHDRTRGLANNRDTRASLRRAVGTGSQNGEVLHDHNQHGIHAPSPRSNQILVVMAMSAAVQIASLPTYYLKHLYSSVNHIRLGDGFLLVSSL